MDVLLDFEFGDSTFKLKCFTNVTWLYDKFKHRTLNFIDDYKDSDICIVDNNYQFKEENYASNFKINIDELRSSADAFISSDYIECYLDMIEKYESEDYGVGMADFTDIKSVTKGSLIEYVKINLNSNDELESVEEFKKSLQSTEFNVGVILFVSIKNLGRLFNLSENLKVIYPNMTAVIMTPAKMRENMDNYIEVFVFK